MNQVQRGCSRRMASVGAYHATHDSLKIFDDFLADALFTPEEHTQTDQDWAGLLKYIDPELAASCPDQAAELAWLVRLTNGPITLGRSRYTEDSLEEAIRNGARQYVILGAGFDTFAYRRPDLADRVQVFALDHPATQALMQGRVAAAGWPHPANLHYVPIDFTRTSLKDALGGSPYDPGQKSFFSWLGVSFYLDREVVRDTLRGIASNAAQSSQVVFDYLGADAFIPEKAGKRMQLMQGMAQQLGEPLKTGFDPLLLAAELAPPWSAIGGKPGPGGDRGALLQRLGWVSRNRAFPLRPSQRGLSINKATCSGDSAADAHLRDAVYMSGWGK